MKRGEPPLKAGSPLASPRAANRRPRTGPSPFAMDSTRKTSPSCAAACTGAAPTPQSLLPRRGDRCGSRAEAPAI